MAKNLYSVIVGTGSYIPSVRVPNSSFLNTEFYGPDGERIKYAKGDNAGQIIQNSEIIEKFEDITGIKERRYVTNDLVTSDIGYLAALDCLNSSGIDKEGLSYIIFAHNFGDVRSDNRRSDFVPSLAARVKHKLGIANPWTVAYDVPFGCPGWLEAVIQADDRLKMNELALVLGGETLSRIKDPFDRDGMIYADGAGGTIVKKIESEDPIGILSHASRSDTLKHVYLLWMGNSYNPNYKGNELFLKMNGHDLYEYALTYVPGVVKKSLDEAGLSLQDVKKVLIHQANEKMDEAILKRLFRLYSLKASDDAIHEIMPMTISWLGNSSVATLPTLLDLIQKGKVDNHKLNSKDVVVFASVGAGMNINSVVYRMP